MTVDHSVGTVARTLVGAVVLTMAAAACGGATAASVYEAAPTITPTVTVTNGACIAPHAATQNHQPTHGLVAVDPHPGSVTAFWLPGLNQRPCTTVSAHYDASTATRLAADIRSSPQAPNGNVNCPNDDGSTVDLYFDYGSGRHTQYLAVGLSGCTWVEAPGRYPRRASAQLLKDLAAVGPQPWANALQHWIS